MVRKIQSAADNRKARRMRWFKWSISAALVAGCTGYGWGLDNFSGSSGSRSIRLGGTNSAASVTSRPNGGPQSKQVTIRGSAAGTVATTRLSARLMPDESPSAADAASGKVTPAAANDWPSSALPIPALAVESIGPGPQLPSEAAEPDEFRSEEASAAEPCPAANAGEPANTDASLDAVDRQPPPTTDADFGRAEPEAQPEPLAAAEPSDPASADNEPAVEAQPTLAVHELAQPSRTEVETAETGDKDHVRRVLTVLGWKKKSPPSAHTTSFTPSPADEAASASSAQSRPASELVANEAAVEPAVHRQPVERHLESRRVATVNAELGEPTTEAPEAPAPRPSAIIESVVDQPIPAEVASPRRTASARLQGRSATTVDQASSPFAAPVEVANAPGQAEPRLQLAQAKAPPPPAPAPANADPFEVIDQTGEIKVTMRRSKLLKLKLDVFRIAIVDPSICDVIQYTPHELSIVGKQVGATHVTFWFDDGNQRPVTYLVTVEPDVRIRQQIEEDFRKLEGMISELFPDSYIRLIPMADKVIVKGQAKDAEEAAQILSLLRAQTGGGGGGGGGWGSFNMGLNSGVASDLYNDQETGNSARPRIQIINMLRVPGIHQVALRVKIAELNRSAARNFGLGVGGTVNFTSNPKGSQLFIQSMLGLASGGTATAATAPTFLAQFDGDDIRVGIRYMQKAGVLRLLSEPTLVTLSGQPATFVAGGEFAVPTLVGSVGLNAVTTDFRSYGAIIFFVPTVVDKDRIRLQVSPEFSQINEGLTNSQTGTPGLNVRAVTTTVEMREGQTFAIAGLLEDTMKSASASDIPFLYKLFGVREVNRSETELIILVTPELVHPMDPEEVPPLPGFDVTEPSNVQFFLHGELEGTPTRDWRSTTWPRLRQRYNAGGSSMISGPFGHGQ